MTTTHDSEVEYIDLPTGTSDERFEGWVRLIIAVYGSDDPDETTRRCLRALVDLANVAGDDPASCVLVAQAARVMGGELDLTN